MYEGDVKDPFLSIGGDHKGVWSPGLGVVRERTLHLIETAGELSDTGLVAVLLRSGEVGHSLLSLMRQVTLRSVWVLGENEPSLVMGDFIIEDGFRARLSNSSGAACFLGEPDQSGSQGCMEGVAGFGCEWAA